MAKPAYSPNDPVWHIMTRTRGGTVSLLKNLTEDVARQTMRRLPAPFRGSRDNPWSDEMMVARAREEADRPRREMEMKKELDEKGYYTFSCQSGSGGFYTPSDGDIEQVECFGPEGRHLEIWPKPKDYDKRYAKALEEARRAIAQTPTIKEDGK